MVKTIKSKMIKEHFSCKNISAAEIEAEVF